MAQPCRDSLHINSGSDQECSCGMPEAMERYDRQLIFQRFVSIVTMKHILQSLIRCGVVHHLAVVLYENPIPALPEVAKFGFEPFSGLF